MARKGMNLTEKEKLSINAFGTEGKSFAMGSDNDIDTLIETEKRRKMNNELESSMEIMEKKHKDLVDEQEKLNYSIDSAEIKPMASRVLVMPFKENPFQKVEVKNGIIVAPLGYELSADLNPQTGKYEEMDQLIVVGAVMEVGPEVKYLKEGDAVYYRKDTAVPVPFLREKLVSIAEQQIIAVVNVGLEDRFNKIKE